MTTRILPVLALLLACDADSVPPPNIAAAAEVNGSEQQRREVLTKVRPITTRAGHPRFTDPVLRDPLAAGVFAERLADASVAEAERVALAEALPRCGGAWADVALTRLAIEEDPAVRAVLIGGLQRATDAQALAGARAGLADADANVRRAAAELAGWVPAVGKALSGELQVALADGAAEVRAAATRAIGLTGDSSAFDVVARGLKDGDPQVRLEAVRSIKRIDAGRAKPALVALQDDADSRVQRAARSE